MSQITANKYMNSLEEAMLVLCVSQILIWTEKLRSLDENLDRENI